MKKTTPITIDQALNLDKTEILDLYSRHINSVFAGTVEPFDLMRRYVRAKGTYIWDDQGRRYIDFFGGFGCLNLGHNHPAIAAALQKVIQEDRLMIHQLLPQPLQSGLAHNLSLLLPPALSMAYFQSSGSESVEAAIKLARAYTGQPRILAAHNGYHGRTLAALSLTGMPHYQEPFRPLLEPVDHIPFGDPEALANKLAQEQYAAFFVEPIQGQGGVFVPPPGYLREVRRLCDAHKVLLVLDEVQTGMGRTGKLFAFEHEAVVPDILITSKSLGGGMVPISACITTPAIWGRVYGSIKKFLLHSSTFSGNSLACAAGMAVLATIHHENLLENCTRQGNYFFSELARLKKQYPIIKEIRGKGLMVGIVFDLDNTSLLSRISDKIIRAISPKIVTAYIASRLLNEHGVIVPPSLTNEYFLRVYPPLNVQRADLDYFLHALEAVCSDLDSCQKVLINSLPKLASYYLTSSLAGANK